MNNIIYKSIAVATIIVGLSMSALAFAAANPSGTGQPSQSCQSEPMMPNGFTTQGFANAETHYAGSDGTPSLAHANSTKAVSQYDVACYQVSQSH